ncbi:hypothetical protein GWI33_019243 [Rhynchophorus ferrugineus]|uniref:Transmembrane protein 186 n=1 Tax=Rhynchophorus ferrugineus TaxID=354439 RepID=A0A834I5R2_RHYFE|nr:hypothetical protein GWI33_019243 [Rhynchophorus ferrugineus]
MAVLSQQNILPMESLITGSIVGGALCAALLSTGYFINNLIGYIYYNQKTETAKISYVDFWGKRKNIEIPVVDIVPICDTKPSIHDKLFISIQRYSTKDTLKLNLNYGVIYDTDKFQKIL